MEMTVYDAFLGTIFKSLRFQLSTLETGQFQNDALTKGSTFQTLSKASVFVSGHFGHFSVNDRWKGSKKYAFLFKRA